MKHVNSTGTLLSTAQANQQPNGTAPTFHAKMHGSNFLNSPNIEQEAMTINQDGNTYEPKNILVTGGAGFIGSHVVERLAKRYPTYRLVVLDRLDYCGAPENLKELEKLPNFKFVRGDIRSKSLIDYLLDSEKIDTVLHFAASTHVDNSFHSSISFTSNNVLGTHVLLESVRAYGKVGRFIHVSTDEVYGGEKDMSSDEDSMLAPTNPYACTKAAAEFICRAYSISYNVPIVMTRGNNVYGPRQYPDKLIAKNATLLAAERKAFIHGDGSHRRNYIYVTDCAEAFDVILHKALTGGVYNLGSEVELSNVDVVRQLVRLIRFNGKMDVSDSECDQYIEFVQDRPFNDRRYRVDGTRLAQLGWTQNTSWEKGLQLTAEWYSNRENLRRWPNYVSGLVAHPLMEADNQNQDEQFIYY